MLLHGAARLLLLLLSLVQLALCAEDYYKVRRTCSYEHTRS